MEARRYFARFGIATAERRDLPNLFFNLHLFSNYRSQSAILVLSHRFKMVCPLADVPAEMFLQILEYLASEKGTLAIHSCSQNP